MEFILKLDLPDAEQEAVWLNDYLQEVNIPGLESGVVQRPPVRGAMSGELYTELLKLAATTAVGEVIKQVITAIFGHFKGKKAKLELTGQCPDNGRQFKLSFDTGGDKERNEAIAEFDRLIAEFCGPRYTPNEG